jgi:hypothetical protein
MKHLFSLVLLTLIAIIISSFTYPTTTPTHSNKENGISEQYCNNAFDGNVKTYTLKDGYSNLGHSIWISRKSGKVNAKYFADKQYGQVVHDRYDSWRSGKDVVLMSSGAYATGWDGTDIPVGVTVDNGIVVNRKYDSGMDGLVIVYATGGIVVSNIDDGDLYLATLDKKVDIRNSADRTKFLTWAKDEKATVFQTHLTIYKNQLECYYSSKDKNARRKLLVLAESSDGELFHIIFYFKDSGYTLYNASTMTLNYLKGKGMDVIAAINLDTGNYDIINTGSGVKDCSGNHIEGTRNAYRKDLTNMLTYSYEE